MVFKALFSSKKMSPEQKAERKVVRKIDFFILSYAMLAYWSNYLDRANLSNSYLAGMKEDLGMYGNELNQINSIFTAGYIIGQIPQNLMLQVVQPRIWFPAMNLTWGILTLLTAFVKDYKHIMVIRFFQAIAESSTFVGGHWILGSWYKGTELGKRSALFACSAQLGTLFSGIMQAAILETIDGHAGFPSWRWLFVIDCLITVPIAIYGFFTFPDTPATTTARWLTEEEKKLVVSRLPPKAPKEKITLKSLYRVFRSWQFWAFGCLFMVTSMLESFGINSLMGIWMRDPSIGYSRVQANYWPSGFTAVAIVCAVLGGLYTDWRKDRFDVNVFMVICLWISSIILLVYDVPRGVQFFAFYLAGAGYAGQGSNFAWANEACDNDLQRGVTLAGMNVMSGVLNSFYSILLYPANDAPRFRKGMIAMIVCGAVSLVVAIAVRILDRRHRAQKARMSLPPTDSEGGSVKDQAVEDVALAAPQHEKSGAALT